MGTTHARCVGLAIFLGLVTSSSHGYAGTITESNVEFFAQPIDVTSATVVDGLGYADALWADDVERANIGIFTEVDGLPAALVTQTGPFQPISGTYDFPVSPATTLSAGSYWVVGGFNRTGSLARADENEAPDYVASLPSSWTFGDDFYYLFEDVVFYTVTEEPVTSGSGTIEVGYSSVNLSYGLEYITWASNFGSDSPPRTFTPEPTTCGLLALGVLSLTVGLGRRR